MKGIAKYSKIEDDELKRKVFETAYIIFKELKANEEEFRKALEYYSYVHNLQTTLDNIIRRNELTLKEFKILELMLELEEFAKKKNVEIVSMTTLLKSVFI